MPNPAGTPVKLDRKRSLRYTNRALVKLEEETGLTISEAAERMGAGSLKVISAVIWAGLLHSDATLTPDEVVDMIDLKRLEEIGEAVGAALDAAVGGNGTDPADEKKAQQD